MNLSGTASEELEKCISITLDLLNQAIEAVKAADGRGIWCEDPAGGQ